MSASHLSTWRVINASQCGFRPTGRRFTGRPRLGALPGTGRDPHDAGAQRLLGKALRGLTGLRELAVCGGDGGLEVSEQERMLAVLPELQQLTSVRLCLASLQPDNRAG